MKRLVAIIPILFLFFGIVSCQKQDIVPEQTIIDGDRVMVNFTSGLGGSVQSRVNNNQWTAGDTVGIYMVRHGQTLSAGSISEKADNIGYVPDLSGNMTPASASKRIYYPAGGGAVDFISYYPRANNITNYIYRVDVNPQFDDINKLDLLYSNNAVNANDGAPGVQLQYRHMLAQISIQYAKGPGVNTLTNINPSFSGVYNAADFLLSNGTFTNYSVGSIFFGADQTELTSNIFMVPSGPMTGRSLSILASINGGANQTYIWNIPENTTFESGNRYIYTVEVHNKGTRSVESSPGLSVRLDSVEEMK